MKVVHLSYNIPKPTFTDPEAWLMRISFSTGVMEAMTAYAEVIGIYHIQFSGMLKKNNVTYYFTRYRWDQVFIPLRFNLFVKRLNPDVVIVHGLIFPWQVIMLKWQLGRRVVIIAQHHAERPLGDIRQYIQMWADRYIHAYLFSSKYIGQKWIDKRQIKSQKKVIEIMGTSSPFSCGDREHARSITHVKDDPVYLWVGGLDANKDPITVLKAFKKFLKLKMDAKLYIIYQTFDLLEDMKMILLENPELKDSIYLIGKVENYQLENWYNSADFIISSSHYEGSGIAVCEAMSCGCIPILTSIPSFRMMTNDGSLGLLYTAGNIDELKEALEKSLTLTIENEKLKVLAKFKVDLSFEANARKILEAITEASE